MLQRHSLPHKLSLRPGQATGTMTIYYKKRFSKAIALQTGAARSPSKRPTKAAQNQNPRITAPPVSSDLVETIWEDVHDPVRGSGSKVLQTSHRPPLVRGSAMRRPTRASARNTTATKVDDSHSSTPKKKTRALEGIPLEVREMIYSYEMEGFHLFHGVSRSCS